MIWFILGVIVGLLVGILIVLSLNKEYKEIVVEKKLFQSKQKGHVIDTETEEEKINKISENETTWLN